MCVDHVSMQVDHVTVYVCHVSRCVCHVTKCVDHVVTASSITPQAKLDSLILAESDSYTIPRCCEGDVVVKRMLLCRRCAHTFSSA